jgi:hypothetical protein
MLCHRRCAVLDSGGIESAMDVAAGTRRLQQLWLHSQTHRLGWMPKKCAEDVVGVRAGRMVGLGWVPWVGGCCALAVLC